jgi:demethoxyubiquinone hydroxylase (CLK1/Coq7/Cat5 family)
MGPFDLPPELEKRFKRASFRIGVRGALISIIPGVLNCVFVIVAGHYFRMQLLDSFVFSFALGGFAGLMGVRVANKYSKRKFEDLHRMMIEEITRHYIEQINSAPPPSA